MAPKTLIFMTAIGVFLSSHPSLEAAESAPTLGQCFQWAQDQSESLKIQAEEVKKSEARGRSALGGAFPDLRWKLSNTWQDPSGVEALERKGFAGFVEKEQTESKFELYQPLFSGLREWTAWTGAKRERLKNELLTQRASLVLLEDVANVFYSVLDNETNRDNTRVALALSDDRVKELKGFARLGKARKSEVSTAQAHAAALKADLDQIESSLHAAREELSYLTGHDLSQSPLAAPEPLKSGPVSLDDALSQASHRTDLQAQKEDVMIQKLKARYERGYYWPSINATGTYYTQRATFLDEVDWDVVLNVNMPLFQGGSVRANVREALAGVRQSELQLSQLERRIASQIRALHNDLSYSLQRQKSLEDATAAAQESYNAQREEYRLGLVTNLDVLQAMDFLLDQKRARDTARLRSQYLAVRLNIAMEKLP